MIDYVFFLPQLRELSFSFFLFSSSTWYNVLRRMDMRTYWKHKCCRGHASCWVYSRAKSDVSPISKSSSSSRNIVRRWDLNLQARDSFFECGLFPSRASISVTVWGVIWDKIWKKGRMCHLLFFLGGSFYCAQNIKAYLNTAHIYPEGTQILKKLVCIRNTQKYWADSLTAQTPGCKKSKPGKLYCWRNISL